jgi:hypothetical protein
LIQLAVEYSQTDTYNFSLTGLGDGTLSVQTEMDYPEGGNSLATFQEAYSHTMLLESGSTTNSSFAVQTVGAATTVTVGPITETGASTKSFAYAATGSSTFHGSQPGIYAAAAPSSDPTSGDPPTEAPAASPFEGLPTLTIIDSSETWTDALNINNQSAYEQIRRFHQRPHN